ncbi:uncharacterized protein KQ657_003645 [Scheffersomyces spartinae]|uniref:Peptidase A1 domain-containing protein n=1 Tax=Scheffersomyces spartinae TaxID=45513 RepID=A0A9P7VBW6_9ASCO|nr:uncharacterized protein KQ657_003645 [Scheffersomyces spartinae]KAG7195124.1 hypothetical protein KQ657_003645 [Scheffersomyces spartinae]
MAMVTHLLGLCLLCTSVVLADDSSYVKLHYRTPYDLLFFSDFLVNATFGSSSEEVSMLLSLDSADLWVIADNAVCYDNGTSEECPQAYGSYNFDSSNKVGGANDSSFEYPNYSSNDGFINRGVWGEDKLSISKDDVDLDDFKFGVVEKANLTGQDPYGVLALGFNSTSDDSSNLLSYLKAKGKINRRVVSFIHDNLTENTGYALLGAVDQAKFVGDLQSLPMVNSNMYPSNSNFSSGKFQAVLSELAINNLKSRTVVTKSSYPVVFTTNLDFVYLPPAVFENLAILSNANISFANFIFDCPKYDSSIYIEFNFNGINVTIPYTSFMFSFVEDKCNLGFTVQEQGDFIVLGRSFLKSAYVGFDLDLSEVLLAPRYYTSDELIAVADASTGVPDVTKASAYSSTSISSPTEVQATASAVKYSTA